MQNLNRILHKKNIFILLNNGTLQLAFNAVDPKPDCVTNLLVVKQADFPPLVKFDKES